MADIWAAPPGERVPRRFSLTRVARPTKGFVAAFVVVALIAAGGRWALAWLTTSRPVSTNQAVEAFRAAPGLPAVEDADTTAADPGRDRRGAHPRRAQGRAGARTQPSAASAGSAAASTATRQTSAAPRGGSFIPPKSGVYTYDTEGYERAPGGLRRDLPKESHSILTRTGRHTWTEHQIYSEQREQWLELGLSPDGVAASSVRNRVEFGPIEEDNTIHFDPAAFFLSFPQEVGQTWGGEWTGKTSGDYQARTFDHGWMKIGGERVEFYAVEVHMNFHGEVEGESTVRLWSVAEYRMVVKQWQVTEVDAGPGNYYSEWTRVLRSLEPQQ